MDESGSNNRFGILTRVDRITNVAFFWTRGMRTEFVFQLPRDEDSILKAGTWLEVDNRFFESKGKMGYNVIPAVIKTKVIPDKNGLGPPRIRLSTHIVFPPPEWALQGEQAHRIYSKDVGIVANLANENLMKKNSTLERNIVYKAIISRLPWDQQMTRISKMLGTVWHLPAQKLQAINDPGALDVCPWNQLSLVRNESEEAREGRTATEEPRMVLRFEGSETSADFKGHASVTALSSNSRGESPGAVAESVGAEAWSSYAPRNFLGIVFSRKQSYYVAWGKCHGFVAVHASSELLLQPSQWIIYECIEDDTGIPGIRHTAIFCKESPERPLVSTAGKMGNIICHAVLNSVSSPDFYGAPPKGYFFMECDELGAVLVDDSFCIKRLIQNGELKCTLEASPSTEQKFPWKVISVQCNGIFIPVEECKEEISEVAGCSFASERHQKTKNAEELDTALEACSKSDSRRSPLPEKIRSHEIAVAETALSRLAVKPRQNGEDSGEVDNSGAFSSAPAPGCSTAGEAKEFKDENFGMHPPLDDAAKNVDLYRNAVAGYKSQKVYLALMTTVAPTHGILWSYNTDTILVLPEHLNGFPAGSWVSARAVAVPSSLGLMHPFVTTKVLKRTAHEIILPTRSHNGITQVQVSIEKGGCQEFDADGVCYIARRSELGAVLIPYSRHRKEYFEKRFRAWATIIACRGTYNWVITRGERLTEIDEEGNELPDQIDVPMRTLPCDRYSEVMDSDIEVDFEDGKEDERRMLKLRSEQVVDGEEGMKSENTGCGEIATGTRVEMSTLVRELRIMLSDRNVLEAMEGNPELAGSLKIFREAVRDYSDC